MEAKVKAKAKQPNRSRTKTQNLRFGDQTRFKLEWIAAITGKTFTKVIEIGIDRQAREALVTSPAGVKRDWRDFWHESEAVRELRLLGEPEYPLEDSEHDTRAFILAHRQFFYADEDRRHVLERHAEVLWPRLGDFATRWHETKSENPWAAGLEMATAIKKAKLPAPPWPPGNADELDL